MKAIPRNYQGTMSKRDKELFDRAVELAVKDAFADYKREYETVLVFALNDLGFGRKRLLDLFKTMIRKRAELYTRYSGDKGTDKDIDLDIMNRELRKRGLDPEILVDSAYLEIMDEVADSTDPNEKTVADWLLARYDKKGTKNET